MQTRPWTTVKDILIWGVIIDGREKCVIENLCPSHSSMQWLVLPKIENHLLRNKS